MKRSSWSPASLWNQYFLIGARREGLIVFSGQKKVPHISVNSSKWSCTKVILLKINESQNKKPGQRLHRHESERDIRRKEKGHRGWEGKKRGNGNEHDQNALHPWMKFSNNIFIKKERRESILNYIKLELNIVLVFYYGPFFFGETRYFFKQNVKSKHVCGLAHNATP